MLTQKMRMNRIIRCFSGARSLGVTLARVRCCRNGHARLQASRKSAEGRTLLNARRYVRFVVWLLTLAVGIGVGTVIGQQSPPAENKGLDAKVVSTVDLAPDMPGYQLRLRNIAFEPGGVIGIHSHKDRPAVGYILEGTFTELREGGYVREYEPSEVLTESRDVTHWGENRGTSKVVIVGVDIIKKP